MTRILCREYPRGGKDLRRCIPNLSVFSGVSLKGKVPFLFRSEKNGTVGHSNCETRMTDNKNPVILSTVQIVLKHF